MLNNKFGKIIILTTIQSLLYFIIIQIGLFITKQVISDYHLGISFGISLYYSYLVVIVIYLLANMMTNTKYTNVVKIILLIILFLYWKNSIDIHPIRVGSIIVISIISYFIIANPAAQGVQ